MYAPILWHNRSDGLCAGFTHHLAATSPAPAPFWNARAAKETVPGITPARSILCSSRSFVRSLVGIDWNAYNNSAVRVRKTGQHHGSGLLYFAASDYFRSYRPEIERRRALAWCALLSLAFRWWCGESAPRGSGVSPTQIKWATERHTLSLANNIIA